MITIKQAAELTHVPEHTLRAWERRYQVIETTRTEGGYRVYDDEALTRITAMRELVHTGWSPARAAEEVIRRHPRSVTFLGADDDLLSAAAALDSARVTRVVDEQFARAAFEVVADSWLMPTLSRLGQAWARDDISVAGEHLVTAAVQRRLSAAYEAAARAPAGPTVVVGAPPGVDHELGLLAFATAARRAGLTTIYLGAQVPAGAWVETVTAAGAYAAVTSLHRRRDAARLQPVARALEQLPHLELWAGGRYQHQAPEPFAPLGHSIAAAAAMLAGRDAS